MGRCQASDGVTGEQCKNFRADSDFCHWHADQNPTGQTPRGDVRVTRRSSKAESYETFDPNDAKMAALRERSAGSSSSLPSLPPISSPRALVPTANGSRSLTIEERQQALELRKMQMHERHQVQLRPSTFEVLGNISAPAIAAAQTACTAVAASGVLMQLPGNKACMPTCMRYFAYLQSPLRCISPAIFAHTGKYCSDLAAV